MSIDVRGGAGGTAVALEALEDAARRLQHVAGRLAAVLTRVAALVARGGWVGGHALSPGTAAVADERLVLALGPTGLAGDVAGLEALAGATWSAVTAYRVGETVVATLVEAAQDRVMYELGRDLPVLATGAAGLWASGVDLGSALDRAVYRFPALADLGGGAGGLALGMAVDPLTGVLLVPGLLARHGGERDLAGMGLDLDAVATRVLADSAGPWGAMQDTGPARVLREPRPRATARAPTDLTSLARDQLDLSDAQAYPGHVRVVEVPQDGGSAWLVEVSGTQVWDPVAGTSPFDVTSDVRLAAQEATVLADGVARAVADAQAESGRDASGEPVLLAGHSLGGLVAASLAATPGFRSGHGPLSVVTMGSPVSRLPVPADVPVLSLEHVQDPVPRLDGRPDPDRASWLTVRRDLRDSCGPGTATAAHDGRRYVETAARVDRSTDPSLEQWREAHRRFFQPAAGREPVVRDYRVERAAAPP